MTVPSVPPAPHLDHLLTDSHQLVVELGVGHLHLLQPENPLVTPQAELLLLLLQTLDHLSRGEVTARGRKEVQIRE